MHLLYFNYLYDLKGASIGSVIKPVKLFSAMQQLGHKVTMCWLRESLSEGNQDSSRSIEQRHHPLLRRFLHDPKIIYENIRFAKEESQQIKLSNSDIMVARWDQYLFSAILNAHKYRMPVILEADCPPVYEARTFQKNYWHPPLLAEKIERWTLLNADHVIAQSNELRDYIISCYKINPDKIDMISNGADIMPNVSKNKVTQVRDKYGLQNKIVVGFVGSMSAWHGVENLLNIFSAIIPSHPQIHFMLVGQGGDARRMVETYITEKSYSDRITLLGYVPNEQIPDYLAAMDIVLAPYPRLQFFYYSPVKVFEYMAAAKPVVSTRIGQISELISSGENGLLCDSGDWAEMAQAVIKLSQDSTLRQRLGQAARATIAGAHTWAHKARAWEQICAKVIEKYR